MAVELVSRGAQDVYLTGNPEVSFFRQTYKRHTNFAQRTVKLDTMGTLQTNAEVAVKIPSKGDLLSYVWLDLGSETVDTCGLNGTSETGSAVIELWIGGQLVDRQDAFFMLQHWNKYLLDSSAKGSAASSLGDVTATNWFPLHFFFCDSVYLPLVALQYHEVEIRFKFASSGDPAGIKFYANYIMLDTDERAMFANSEHELLIEQVQKIGYSGNKFDLTLLNHPVKSLHFSAVSAGTIQDGIQLYLNGTETFNVPMPIKFFNQVQGYYHSEYANSELSKQNSEIYMYSFALKANKHQPCGTCNFSRIDTGAFNVTVSGTALAYMYAVNFNILRIKKGLAGLAFSN
jgi:hypothetical protein